MAAPLETIVNLSDIPVMFVAGDGSKPFSEQAPMAFEMLEAKLSSLKGRKFYGVMVGSEYRACAAIASDDDAASLPHPTWIIPGGKYVRRRISDWGDNLHLIGSTFAELRSRPDADPSRHCIEHYRSERELFLMSPII